MRRSRRGPGAGRQEAGLGKLVPFEKRRRIGRAQPAEPAEGKILIFTGVRYQRTSSTLPNDGNTPARPKRKRG